MDEKENHNSRIVRRHVSSNIKHSKKQTDEEKLSGESLIFDDDEMPDANSSIFDDELPPYTNNYKRDDYVTDSKNKKQADAESKKNSNGLSKKLQTTSFKDDPKHLFGLDIDVDSDNKPNYFGTTKQKHSTKFPKKELHVASDRRVWTKLFILIALFAALLWLYNEERNENIIRMRETEDLGRKNVAKIENILAQLRKQNEHIESLEQQLINEQRLNKKQRYDIDILGSRIVDVSKNLQVVNDALMKVQDQIEQWNISTMRDRSIVNERLRKLEGNNEVFESKMNDIAFTVETSNTMLNTKFKTLAAHFDILGSKLTEIDVGVQSLENDTISLVKEGVKNGIEKEMKKCHEKNSLCVRQECQFQTSGTNPVAHVESALEVHRADTLGLPDFAWKAGGGSIHGNHHSATCNFGNPTIKLLGIPLYVDPSSPRLVISSEHNPGDCWHMKGSKGYLVVKLSTEIQPTMVSLEHLDKNLDRYSKYMYLMAPKDCEVYAWLDNRGEKKLLIGTFTYERKGNAIQTFNLFKNISHTVLYVELRILNNWGNPDCTCIYRFRVHGVSLGWAKDEE